MNAEQIAFMNLERAEAWATYDGINFDPSKADFRKAVKPLIEMRNYLDQVLDGTSLEAMTHLAVLEGEIIVNEKMAQFQEAQLKGNEDEL